MISTTIGKKLKTAHSAHSDENCHCQKPKAEYRIHPAK